MQNFAAEGQWIVNTSSTSEKIVNPYRFMDGLTKRLVKTWISLQNPCDIPWTPLRKPLNECTVALISSGGIALKTDAPFDMDIERQDPWWSDPSYRIIPRSTITPEIKVHHLHINPQFAEQDLNCILPLQQLNELADCGEIGGAAPSHYSYIGYTLRPRRLLEESVPAMVRQLQQEKVDVVLLVPV